MVSSPIDVRGQRYEVGQLHVPRKYANDLSHILIPGGLIDDRIRRLGEEITDSYGEDEELALLWVRTGAMYFATHLSQSLSLAHTIPSVSSSGYATGTVGAEDRIIGSLPEEIKGRHVLLVEDILDTGKTLDAMTGAIQEFDVRSLKTAILLDKPDRRTVQGLEIDFTGFIVPDEFVVGCGLDFDQKYRDLRLIGVLKPHIYEG
jgi:hypoxanthine phosphoribosyltransferase